MNTQFDRKNLVGTWQLKVIHQDGPMQGRTDELVVVFEPDEICIILTPGPGTGTWQSSDQTTVTYDFTQLINYDASGKFTHYVIARQKGSMSADGASFTASGESSVYEADGTCIITHHTTTQARRAS